MVNFADAIKIKNNVFEKGKNKLPKIFKFSIIMFTILSVIGSAKLLSQKKVQMIYSCMAITKKDIHSYKVTKSNLTTNLPQTLTKF